MTLDIGGQLNREEAKSSLDDRRGDLLYSTSREHKYNRNAENPNASSIKMDATRGRNEALSVSGSSGPHRKNRYHP